jgi:acetamidase/formamidase
LPLNFENAFALATPKNGSNMGINELGEGSTIFLLVFRKGALVWTGDSHCRQGTAR